jgi:hypothetical protein
MNGSTKTIRFLCHVLGLDPSNDFGFDWSYDASSRNTDLKRAVLGEYSELLGVPDYYTAMNFWKASGPFEDLKVKLIPWETAKITRDVLHRRRAC